VDASSIIDTLKGAVPGAAYEAAPSVDFATIYVPAASLVDTCRALRDTPSLGFNVLVEVTAADYLPRDPRFEVVYHLLSIPNKARVRLKVRVGANEVNGVVPTVQSVWPAAGWPEREVWDMFGIVSSGPSSLAIDMTYDKMRLEEAIKKIAGNELSPTDIIQGPSGSQGPSEVRYRAHVAFSTVNDILQNLEQVHNRRKALVYVSDGYDFNPFQESRLGFTDPNSPFKPLPKSADLTVAMRRSIRVGPHAGRPLEELGITPDERHFMTKRDLLEGNVDLIRHAAEILSAKPIHTLSVEPLKRKNSRGVRVTCKSKIRTANELENISYLNINIDGQFYPTISVENGSIEREPIILKGRNRKAQLLVQAFDGKNDLVAACRYKFED